MKNRRLFTRIPCRYLVDILAGGVTLQGELTDISLGGARIRCQGAFEPATPVALRPNPREPAIDFEVRWCLERGPDRQRETGLRFVGSVGDFWESWAASILAGFSVTHGELVERRATIRVPTGLRAVVEGDFEDFRGHILNVGPGGALVSCDPSFDRGAEFYLSIPQPVTIADLHCRVLRSWKREGGWLHGVEYLHLDSRQELGLSRLIDSLLRTH